MTAPGKLLAQGKPNFFHCAAHDWWHGQKCAEHDRDLHAATRSSKTRKSESTARLISKRRSKQARALARIVSRSAAGTSIQRLSRRVTPVRSSSSAKPAPSFTISRQMLTLFEIKTGVAQASASTTAMPKFSWWEGKTNPSAAPNAPHLRLPLSIPQNVIGAAELAASSFSCKRYFSFALGPAKIRWTASSCPATKFPARTPETAREGACAPQRSICFWLGRAQTRNIFCN